MTTRAPASASVSLDLLRGRAWLLPLSATTAQHRDWAITAWKDWRFLCFGSSTSCQLVSPQLVGNSITYFFTSFIRDD